MPRETNAARRVLIMTMASGAFHGTSTTLSLCMVLLGHGVCRIECCGAVHFLLAQAVLMRQTEANCGDLRGGEFVHLQADMQDPCKVI